MNYITFVYKYFGKPGWEETEDGKKYIEPEYTMLISAPSEEEGFQMMKDYCELNGYKFNGELLHKKIAYHQEFAKQRYEDTKKFIDKLKSIKR